MSHRRLRPPRACRPAAGRGAAASTARRTWRRTPAAGRTGRRATVPTPARPRRARARPRCRRPGRGRVSDACSRTRVVSSTASGSTLAQQPGGGRGVAHIAPGGLAVGEGGGDAPVGVVRSLRQLVRLEATLLGPGDVAGAHGGVGDAQEEVGAVARARSSTPSRGSGQRRRRRPPRWPASAARMAAATASRGSVSGTAATMCWAISAAVLRRQILEGGGDSEVDAPPLGAAESVVHRSADQLVGESIGAGPVLADDAATARRHRGSPARWRSVTRGHRPRRPGRTSCRPPRLSRAGDARRRRGGRGGRRRPRGRLPGWARRSAARRPSTGRLRCRTSSLSTRCCHSSTRRNTLPSVCRASTSTASPSSVPTSWPVAAATNSVMPQTSKPVTGTRVTPGSRRRSGRNGAQRVAGVGGGRAVGHDDEHVRQTLIVDELAEEVDRSAAAPSAGRRSRRAAGRSPASSAMAPMTAPNSRARSASGSPWPTGKRQPEVGGVLGDEAGELAGPGAEPLDRRRRIDDAEHVVEGLGERLVGNCLLLRARAEQHRPTAAWTCRANSVSRRVLPAPASPGTSTTCRAPVRRRRPRVVERAPASLRPTKRERVDEREQGWERDRTRPPDRRAVVNSRYSHLGRAVGERRVLVMRPVSSSSVRSSHDHH